MAGGVHRRGHTCHLRDRWLRRVRASRERHGCGHALDDGGRCAGSTSTSAATAGSTSTSTSQAGSSAGATGGDHNAAASHRHARARPVVLTAADKRAATSKIARSVPARVPNSVAARRNATLASCHSADGGWQADGTVKHAGGSPASYKITVFFTTSSATVIGYGDTVIQVAAGQTKPWTVRGTFDAPRGTRCVLRGVALTA